MDPHSFAQPSLSPTDIFNGLELATTPVQPGPRSYKSRKYRPCDFCRARQVACKIESAPPCLLCSSHGRQCTFVERPKKKRRPNVLTSNGDATGVSGPQVVPMQQQQQYDISSTQLSPGFITHYNNDHAFSDLNGHNGLDESPSQMQPLGSSQDGDTVYNMDPYIHMMPTGPRIRPLDSQSTKCARWIGETGESNPYLMQHYVYDANDEVTISKLTYRRVKTSASQNLMPGEKGEPPAVFMLADDSMAQKGEPRVEEDVLAKAQADIAHMFTEQEALRLVGLFFRFVYPYFPILSKGEFFSSGSLSHSLHSIPLSLLSAIYATALPFMLYDDLLATSMVHVPVPTHQLFRISWIAVTQELHTPRLATLQACLLLLQRAPTNRYTTDTPWKTSLVGWTVSLAQILGLSHECGDWTTIPTWEMSLRKRLWFGVYIMDKWASLGAGMPSHIRADDWDVLPISDDDLEPSTLEEVSNGTPGSFLGLEADAQHFRYLAELTMILSDIMDSYYTLRATRRTAKDLTLSLDIARSLRARLKSWRDSLPPSLALNQPEHVDSRGMSCLSGNSSLSLAYIVATMTLFRALLRPLENLSDVEQADRGVISSKIAVRAGAKECAKEAVEFVEILGRGALDAFWHSWSRANFAIASSFLMQLLLTSPNETESGEINALVSRWRWAMRIGSGSAGSGLMSLGLLRLDGLLLESENVPLNN